METSKRSGSPRFEVIASTSSAVHPAIAVSSSSTGVNCSSPPVALPRTSVPPRGLVAWKRPFSRRVRWTLRRSSVMAAL
ncbi:MAG: hypothetical protein ACXVXG_09920 [Nocardioidaceae bacterium]